MKKNIIKLLMVICLLLAAALAVTACNGAKMTISFIVDGEVYDSIDTSGNEVVAIPQSPIKDGYTFEGWYWDDGTWQRPFTANSLLNEPLTADMSVYAKFVVDWQDNNLQGTEIKTKSLAINGDNLSATVANKVEAFSFVNEIQVADGATFVVAADIYVSNVFYTKTVPLESGDNTYYVWVENGTDSQLYTVTLRRRPIYTVTYVTNGGSLCDSQQVEEDSYASEPTTTKAGYTFVEWNYDFEQAITTNTTITASWTANDYSVTYDANGGTLTETEYTVRYDSAYTLAVPVREGHTFLGWYANGIKITKSNGQSINNWAYAENKTATAQWLVDQYNLTITTPNTSAGTVAGAGVKDYNSEVTVTATEPNFGYEWLGWYNGDECITTELSYTFNMPASALQLMANYKLCDEMLNFDFVTSFKFCIITGIKDKTVTEIVIPEYVTSIYEYAFKNCTGLEKVSWNATNCNSAGSSSRPIFSGCINLSTVVIGDNVIGIPSCAFYDCGSLTSIIIPENIITIGDHAFGNCDNLETVYWNATACTIAGSRYESIFSCCKNLTTIVIGDNVMTVPNYTFRDCESLTSVYYAGDLEGWCGIGFADVYANPMYYAHDLYIDNKLIAGDLIIPDTITKIEDRVFCGCTSITNVYYAGDMEGWCNIDFRGLGANPMYYAHDLYIDNKLIAGDIVIPDTVTKINSYAFNSCTDITSITISDSVMSIGIDAFYDCSKLTRVYYTGNVAGWCNIRFGNFNANPLYYAHNLYIDNELVTELVIPDTVTEIKQYAFYDCTSLTSVTIPDSVTTIDMYAFIGCNELASLTVSVGNTKYHSGGNCLIETESKTLITGCKNSIIPTDGSVTTIGVCAFADQVNLTSITIPDSVTSIGDAAFVGCSNLMNIIICNGVTKIGNTAFWDCSSLTSIVIPDSVIVIDEYAFYCCESLTSVIIGENVTTIGDNVFLGCSSLTNIVIPDSVISIGFAAFSFCDNLTSVYYKGGAADWTKISIDYYNTDLTNATRYYYSETEPQLNGRYWHYVDGEVAVW